MTNNSIILYLQKLNKFKAFNSIKIINIYFNKIKKKWKINRRYTDKSWLLLIVIV